MTQNNNPYFDQVILTEITNIACDDITLILDELDIQYRKYGKMYVGCCPVHGGDNTSAWNLYPDGFSVRGFWKCRSRHCEKKWKPTFLGLVRAVLSKNRNEEVSWIDTVKWVIEKIGYKDIKNIPKPDEETINKRRYNNAVQRLNLKPKQPEITFSREKIRQILDIPAKYYLDRGFSAKVLDDYCVGYYNKKHRIAVPVFDESGDKCIGFTARSLYEKCDKCGFYHKPDSCPSNDSERRYSSKWLNSKDFESKNCLYNYWNAKEHIAKNGAAILVEGPGDVWRLIESGIQNVVAIFGTDLTEEQMVILERSGALSVICMFDNDEAGKNAVKNIKKQLSRTYRLFFPKFLGNDVGDLQEDVITSDIRPLIEKVSKIYE